ncbi:MAG: hypothetical protein WCC17_15650 [Candidatus Nitrosopolaris sp.]
MFVKHVNFLVKWRYGQKRDKRLRKIPHKSVCYSCGIHGETGISYGIDKPILILKDKNVSLGGLPSYLAKSKPTIQLEFDPNDLHDCQP